jgi:hypothetical protein
MKNLKLLFGLLLLCLISLSTLPGSGQISRCEDNPLVTNNGWCLPAPNGGQYCGSGGCNCTCDDTYWESDGTIQ